MCSDCQPGTGLCTRLRGRLLLFTGACSLRPCATLSSQYTSRRVCAMRSFTGSLQRVPASGPDALAVLSSGPRSGRFCGQAGSRCRWILSSTVVVNLIFLVKSKAYLFTLTPVVNSYCESVTLGSPNPGLKSQYSAWYMALACIGSSVTLTCKYFYL